VAYTSLNIDSKLEMEVKPMKYSKPKVIAKNAPEGGYAAGCPAPNSYQCKTCFRQ